LPKLIIAISGPAGSGKTTHAKRLAKDLGLRYFSAGQIFRQMALERGVSLEELSKIAEKDPTIDLEIDRRTFEEARRGKVVLEGHLTAWIVKDIADVKIYLNAPLKLRILRIASREQRPIEEVARETLLREYSQLRRFMKFYGLDIRDLSIFDLVLDTSKLNIEQTYQIIRQYIKARLNI